MSVGQVSECFCNWYCDETIPGHFLLRPSIWVLDALCHVVSPLSEKECAGACLEVAIRAVAVIVLPILGLIALVFVPLGLISKVIGDNCFKKPQNRRLHGAGLPLTIKHFPVQQGASFRIIETPSSDSSSAEFCSFSDDEDEVEIARAVESCDKARCILNEILFYNVNSERLKEAEDILKDLRPGAFFFERDLYDEFLKLNLWIDSLKRKYDYYSKVCTEEGEIQISDNGDCLFESFLTHSEMAGSVTGVTQETINQERLETVKWMEENCENNPDLQGHLINSLFEQYLTQIETIEQELLNLKSIPEANETKGLITLAMEKQKFLLSAIVKIQSAGGKAFKKINFEKIKDLLPEYFEQMKQPGTFGGAAELFTLSCRRQYCVKIHNKNGRIETAEPISMNARFESPSRAARHFTFESNHYNPIFPHST